MIRIGAKVMIVKLTDYDKKFHPELNLGDIGTIVEENDFFPEIVVVDFDGQKYNMEYWQLVEAKIL